MEKYTVYCQIGIATNTTTGQDDVVINFGRYTTIEAGHQAAQRYTESAFARGPYNGPGLTIVKPIPKRMLLELIEDIDQIAEDVGEIILPDGSRIDPVLDADVLE